MLFPPSCLEDSDDGKYHCPVCAQDNQTVIAILQQLDAVSNVDEDFHRQVSVCVCVCVCVCAGVCALALIHI